MPFYGLFEMK